MKHTNSSDGFTVIEVVITLIIAVVFVLAINTLFITVIRSTASARNRATASTLTYSYLRQYAYTGAVATWFECSSASNLQSNAEAPGQVLKSGTLDKNQTTLPQPVSYSIKAYAPYGCGSTNVSPLLVRAAIVYGPDNLSIDHAGYVGQLQ